MTKKHVLGHACISHLETPFFQKVREFSGSEPEWTAAEAQRILQKVSSWRQRLEQLIRSAHECGTAATAQEARERFNAINEERLEDFLAKKGERIETLLWDGVYAQLLMRDVEPDHLASLFEAIRAFDLLRIVRTLEGQSRPPSWYSHCDLPISHPRTFGASRAAQEQEGRDTAHPVSGVRELAADDVTIVERTLEAIERTVK